MILPASLLVDHAVSRAEVAAGGAGRPVDLGVPSLQDDQELLRTPVGMSAAQLEDGLGDLDRGLVGASFGSPRSFA